MPPLAHTSLSRLEVVRENGRLALSRTVLYVLRLVLRASSTILRSLTSHIPIFQVGTKLLQLRSFEALLLSQVVAKQQSQPQPVDSDMLPPSIAQLRTENQGLLQPSRNSPRRRPHRKKALLIGIKYACLEGQELVGPHKDVFDMRQLLTERYDYSDITILVDNDDPGQMKPTLENMLTKIREFTLDSQPGDTLFFHYAGHSTQMESEDSNEEDGMDEGLVPLDGGFIRDNDLRKYFVDPLPQGCTFIAIFDTCHSGSILDLEHDKCNSVYTPWVSKGTRRSKSLWSCRVRQHAKYPSPKCSGGQRLPSGGSTHQQQRRAPMRTGRPISSANRPRGRSIQQVLGVIADHSVFPSATFPLKVITNVAKSVAQASYMLDSPHRRFSSPERLFPCEGFCRERTENKPEENKLVVSLSAARDDQKSWEDRSGASMTQALIRLLNEDPEPSFKRLLTRVSHDLHRSYVKLHYEAREYKKRYRSYAEKARKNNRPMREPQEVEMNNFQDPQLSSLYPLNMDDKLRL